MLGAGTGVNKCLKQLPAARSGYTVRAPAGTYAGMVEKLDYLQSLGVNAIELLPVFEFNELEYYSPIAGSDQFRCGRLGEVSAIFLGAGVSLLAAGAIRVDSA